MKLYELKRGSKIYYECSDESTFLIFDHIDGMYSFCTTENSSIAHLRSSIELEPFNDGYRIVEEP